MGLESNEVDHKGRLEKCRQFFVDSVESGIRAAEVGQGGAELGWIAEIIEYLFDTWSAIRLEAAKRLKASSPVLPQCAVSRLMTAMMASLANRNSCSWQELHGALEGIMAIISRIDSDQLSYTLEGCLALIGHVSIPVREAASDCLSALYPLLANKSDFVHRILIKIESLIDDKSLEHDEEPTLTLDGCLSSLASIFAASSKPGVPARREEPVDCSDLDMHIERHWALLADIVTKCFYHPASSVRQRAGHVSTLLLAHSVCQFSTCSVSFPHMLSRLLLSVLSVATENGSWCAEEACLIVSDDIARTVLDRQLQALCHCSPLLPSHHLCAILELEILIRRQLAYFLGHPRFEVRRIILQVLPTLARCTLLFGHLSESGDLELSDEERGKESGRTKVEELHAEVVFPDRSRSSLGDGRDVHEIEQEEATEGGRGTLRPNTQLSLSSKMVWASVLIKENRHMVEVLHASGLLTAIFPSSDQWSLEMSGRLQEVHQRQEFHSSLLNAVSVDGGLDCLCRALQWHDDRLLSLLHDVQDSFRACVGSSEPLFLSADFVEFYPLMRAYLHALTLRGHWSLQCPVLSASVVPIAQHLQLSLDASMSSLWLQYLAIVRFSHAHHTSTATTATSPGSARKRSSGVQANTFTGVEFLIASQLASRSPLRSQDSQPPLFTPTKMMTMMTATTAAARGAVSPEGEGTASFPMHWCAGDNGQESETGSSGSVYIPGVLLLPSLMDPSTHPLLHLSVAMQLEPTNTQSRQPSCDEESASATVTVTDNHPFSAPLVEVAGGLQTPARARREESALQPQAEQERSVPRTPSSGCKLTWSAGSGTPHRSRSTLPAALHSPQRVVMSSLHTPSSIVSSCPTGQSTGYASSAHALHALPISSRNPFAAMDRWNCEAIAPLLCTLAHDLRHLHQAVWLLSVVIEWISVCAVDALRLDGRHYARKMLFEAAISLAGFVLYKLPSAPLQIVSEVRILAVLWTRMLGETLQLKFDPLRSMHSPPSHSQIQQLDVKALMPIVKILLSVETMACDVHPELFGAWMASLGDFVQVRDVAPAFPSQQWLQDTVMQLCRTVRWLHSRLSNMSFNGCLSQSRDMEMLVSSSSPLQLQSTLSLEPLVSNGLEELEVAEVEEEFSDWDEEDSVESRGSESLIHTSDAMNRSIGNGVTGLNGSLGGGLVSTTSGGGKKYSRTPQMLSDLFTADVEYLNRQVNIWRTRLNTYMEA